MIPSSTILADILTLAFLALVALALLGWPTRSAKQALAHGENLLLEVLQRRCRHESGYVTADALEGSVPDMEARHCQRCGALKVIYGVHSRRDPDGFWRAPRASWTSVPGYGTVRARTAREKEIA